MDPNLVKTSKFLSLVLRHKPEEIGLVLDENGWADVDDLLARVNQHGQRLTREVLQVVVESNDKRHGKPVVLRVESGRMHAAGKTFFLSDNGVWLTDAVPCEYLII